MLQIIWFSLVGGLFSLAGGLVLITNTKLVTKIMTWLITFAAGAFMAVGFLDILPEGIEAVAEPHYVFIATLVGFTVFFGFERFLMKYFHRHRDSNEINHQDHTESLPMLLMVGDSLHNFLDGALIALAYVANPALGLPTALGIAAHEVPQEIGDFAILLNSGWSKTKIIVFNVISSLFTILGAVIAYIALSFVEGWIPYLLGGAAGVFIYIAASDLIPEIHHRARHRHFLSVMLFFILGLVITGYLVFKTHSV